MENNTSDQDKERLSKSASSSPIGSPNSVEKKLEDQVEKYKDANKQLMELLGGSEQTWAQSVNEASSENELLQGELLLLLQKMKEYEAEIGPLDGLEELLAAGADTNAEENGENESTEGGNQMNLGKEEQDEDENANEEDEEEDEEGALERMMELEAKINALHEMQEKVSHENLQLELELAQLLEEEVHIGDKIQEYQEAIVTEEGKISHLLNNIDQAKADVDTYNTFLVKEKGSDDADASKGDQTEPDPQVIKAQNMTLDEANVASGAEPAVTETNSSAGDGKPQES